MIAFPLVAVLAFAQAPVSDTTGAYYDPVARRLVAGVRARRATVDRSITSYHATVRERIAVGIRALRRDRMLFRRELALRVHWFRDSTGSVEVLGGREAVPIAVPVPELPSNLRRNAPDYAFDPADERLTVGWSRDERDARDTAVAGDRDRVEFGHPLADGSEVNYRFAAGDSSRIAFPDGRVIRLRELRVTPRRLAFRLVTGSFWIEERTHAVVRALVRPARAFDLERDIEPDDDDDDIPAFVKPIRIEVRFITIDYGLWDGRWWLPRQIAMDAVASAANIVQTPLRYELTYGDYEVRGDTTARRAPRPSRATAAEDSAARERCNALGEMFVCKCRNAQCRAFEVAIPADTAALLASVELPPPFGGTGDTLVSRGEMEELAREIGALPAPPWTFQARPPRWGLARYNRVEGLSLGARGEVAFGRLHLDGTARLATSDAELDLEAGLARARPSVRYRVAAYRRLAAVDPAARSLGIGNSLGALLLGRDDGEYYRALGAELTITPAVTEAQRFSVRVYAERQTNARKRTDFSLPHAFSRDHRFRPNIAADSADQLGAALTFRTQLGVDPEASRWSAEVTLDGGAGTYGFGRVSGALRLATPLTPRTSAAVEVAAGMAAGRVPAQSLWYLGGPATLRGYDGNVLRGDAFWRGRAELGSRWPAARLVVFGDVGRAGARDRLSLARPLVSAGMGVSFLDGLVRVDLARALRDPHGWRLDFYTDGIL